MATLRPSTTTLRARPSSGTSTGSTRCQPLLLICNASSGDETRPASEVPSAEPAPALQPSDRDRRNWKFRLKEVAMTEKPRVDPSRRAATRRSLHGVAELVLAGPQYRTSGSIELRVTPGGFATTVAPDPGRRAARRGRRHTRAARGRPVVRRARCNHRGDRQPARRRVRRRTRSRRGRPTRRGAGRGAEIAEAFRIGGEAMRMLARRSGRSCGRSTSTSASPSRGSTTGCRQATPRSTSRTPTSAPGSPRRTRERSGTPLRCRTAIDRARGRGRRARLLPRGSAPHLVRRAAMSAICAGPTRQQPPTSRAPCATQLSICSGAYDARPVQA